MYGNAFVYIFFFNNLIQSGLELDERYQEFRIKGLKAVFILVFALVFSGWQKGVVENKNKQKRF